MNLENGTISGTVTRNGRNRLVYKTYRRIDGTTYSKAYILPEQAFQRRTPVSEHEKQIRLRFKEAGERAALLSEEQKKQYTEEWIRSKFMFNGKKYCTIRGYIMARVYAEMDTEQTQTGGNT